MRAEPPAPQSVLVCEQAQTVRMRGSLVPVLLLLASSQVQGRVYNVGEEAEVLCQQVEPLSLHRVKFYKAGIPTKIYW